MRTADLEGVAPISILQQTHSHSVLSSELSNTLDTAFCIDTLSRALEKAQSEIFNTDQGSQFTSKAFLTPLKEQNIRISTGTAGEELLITFLLNASGARSSASGST